MNEVISTLIVGLILLAITALIITKRIKARKNNSCGCGCHSCLKASSCSSIKEFFVAYKSKRKNN